MRLSKENLNLARIASSDPKRVALTGIYVDPKRGVAAASDGGMLVEVALPKSNGKADDTSEPFILPAGAAREAARKAPDGGVDAVKAGDKNALVVDKGSAPIGFEPVAAEFPDYRNDGIFGKGESIALSFRTESVARILGAAGIGELVKLTLFTDRLRVESTSKDGESARGVLMCFGKPAARKTAAEPEKPAPARVAEDTSDAAAGQSGRRFYGGYRKRGAAGGGGKPSGPPTPGQIAFYAYLLNRRDVKLTPKILEDATASEKIEALKKNLPVDRGRCTWPQWKKLYLTLRQQEADARTICEALNGLTDVASTSRTIDEWIKKDAAEPVEAAA